MTPSLPSPGFYNARQRGGCRSIAITRVAGARRQPDADCAATEEPLEIRLHGAPFAVVMRTPGADIELTAGFLLAERVLRCADDLGAIAHCRTADPDAPDEELRRSNVVNVMLAGDAIGRLDAAMSGRRQVTTSSSCGLCGRTTIESLCADAPPTTASWRVAAPVLAALPERLRTVQHVFDATGGLHAAGLFRADGRLADVAEDVGRHNAVDKVIGRALMADALPLDEMLLFVSGRCSFEIVQKALIAAIPIVASVSAPSTLAIDLAAESGITLIGFLRGDGFNVYTHPHRLAD